MTQPPTPILIPLMEISEKVQHGGQGDKLPKGLKRISEVEISASQKIPEQCYAMEVSNIVKESVITGKSLGIFGSGKDATALNDIYALGLSGREPLICKLIKSDAPFNSSDQGEASQSISSSHVKTHRKSFMTPTPLHIPESKVSPIPDSTHEMIYLKEFDGNDSLIVVPLREVVWMHPLIAMI